MKRNNEDRITIHNLATKRGGGLAGWPFFRIDIEFTLPESADFLAAGRHAARRKNTYYYNEYITSTPVTEAVLIELRKMKRNPARAYRTAAPFYFMALLNSLDNFRE